MLVRELTEEQQEKLFEEYREIVEQDAYEWYEDSAQFWIDEKMTILRKPLSSWEIDGQGIHRLRFKNEDCAICDAITLADTMQSYTAKYSARTDDLEALEALRSRITSEDDTDEGEALYENAKELYRNLLESEIVSDFNVTVDDAMVKEYFYEQWLDEFCDAEINEESMTVFVTKALPKRVR